MNERNTKPGPIEIELLRQYIEDELRPQERQAVQQRIQESEAWRNEWERLESRIRILRTLPSWKPPQRVWARIETEIHQLERTPAWWIWLQDLLTWRRITWAAVSVLVVICAGTMMPWNNSDFEIVDVHDSNGFRLEVDTYIANHDVNTSRPLTQDNLLAFFPVGASDDEPFDD